MLHLARWAVAKVVGCARVCPAATSPAAVLQSACVVRTGIRWESCIPHSCRSSRSTVAMRPELDIGSLTGLYGAA
eukprot:COSAG02_NODE_303_length_25213_cov_126.386199_5_plen_75_part_00